MSASSPDTVVGDTASRASAQLDEYVNPEEVGNPEGGWEDEDYMFEALWEEEAWDHSDAY